MSVHCCHVEECFTSLVQLVLHCAFLRRFCLLSTASFQSWRQQLGVFFKYSCLSISSLNRYSPSSPDHLTGHTLRSLNEIPKFLMLCVDIKQSRNEVGDSPIWVLLFQLTLLFSLDWVQTHSDCCAASLQKEITFPEALPMQLYKERHSTVQEIPVYAPDETLKPHH